MKLCTWNVRRASKTSSNVWDYLLKVDADILLLQEVNSIPDIIKDMYTVHSIKAMGKTGNLQRFSTVVLVKGKIDYSTKLSSNLNWVNNELKIFRGNLVYVKATLTSGALVNLISVYSPAWPIDKDRIKNIDISSLKLKNNPELWVTEILYSALKNEKIDKSKWIVSGDFNSSVTFDTMWGNKPRGNQEIQDRMTNIGFTECINQFNKMLVPTFKNPKGGKIIHQMDHVFVSKELYPDVKSCIVEKENLIFSDSLSDHLPIITEFKN